jgi:hypothetical protein
MLHLLNHPNIVDKPHLIALYHYTTEKKEIKK